MDVLCYKGGHPIGGRFWTMYMPGVERVGACMKVVRTVVDMPQVIVEDTCVIEDRVFSDRVVLDLFKGSEVCFARCREVVMAHYFLVHPRQVALVSEDGLLEQLTEKLKNRVIEPIERKLQCVQQSLIHVEYITWPTQGCVSGGGRCAHTYTHTCVSQFAVVCVPPADVFFFNQK